VIDFVWPLIDVLYLDLPVPTDDRKPKKIPLNEANFARKEFQALWGRINHKRRLPGRVRLRRADPQGDRALDKHLNVAALQYVVQAGQQREQLEADDLTSGSGFKRCRPRRRTPRP
jgi:type III restriction enzyme